MTRSKYFVYILLLYLSVTRFTIKAQETSFYSQYGIGDKVTPAFAGNRGLSGLSAAWHDKIFVNPANPASYTSILLTSFDLGAIFSTRSLTINEKNYTSGDAFFDYINLTFPTNKGLAISAGLQPYSRVSYDFQENYGPEEGLGEAYRETYTGSGRLYKLFGGAAYEIKGKRDSILPNSLSIGMNVGYLFGRRNYEQTLTFPDNSSFFSSRITQTYKSSDVVFDWGVQYNFSPGDSARVFTIGFYTHQPFLVRSRIEERQDRYRILSLGIDYIDTLVNTTNQRIEEEFPEKYAIGFTYKKLPGRVSNSYLMLGLDFEYNTNKGLNTTSFSSSARIKNNMQVTVAAELIPFADRGRASFLRRSSYRIGAFFNDGLHEYGGERIHQAGASFGIGLPISSDIGKNRKLSRLNLSFEVRRIFANGDPLIPTETVFRAYLGFALNGKWFQKAKYF